MSSMVPINQNFSPAAEQLIPPAAAPNNGVERRVAAIHAACAPEICSFHQALSQYLPAAPRTIVVDYLEDARVCIELRGWEPGQRTREAVNRLFIERMISVAEDSTNRIEAARKGRTSALATGFWYPNEYFELLQTNNQPKRLEYFKKRGNFYHGLPPQGFDPVLDAQQPSGKKLSCYKLKEGVLPSEGLANVRKTLCFIDCQEGIELAYYETLLAVLGEEQFNRVFRADGPSPLDFHTDIAKTSLMQFISARGLHILGEMGARPIQPGEAIYMKNLPLYMTKHQQGEWAGFHVVCIQNEPVQKFIGFGTPSEGLTESQIVDLFVREFNKRAILTSEICDPKLTKAIQATVRWTPPPGGMTVEQFSRLVTTYQISKGDYLNANQQNPGELGCHNYALALNLEAMRQA